MRNHSWLYHLTWVVCSRNVGKPQHPWRSQSLKHHNAQNGPPNKFCRDKIIFIELPQFNLSHNFLIFSMATKNGCVNEKIWLRIPIFWSSSGYKLNRSPRFGEHPELLFRCNLLEKPFVPFASSHHIPGRHPHGISLLHHEKSPSKPSNPHSCWSNPIEITIKSG